MIGYLQGRLMEIRDNHVVILAGDVGYIVHVSKRLIENLPLLDETVAFRITTVVREDAFLLYGFETPLEQTLFSMLTSVSGIGPKHANLILAAESEQILHAIAERDVAFFKNIKGVGAKTAEKIIVELKSAGDKLAKDTLTTNTKMRSSKTSDVQAALMTLGFNERQVSSALDYINSQNIEGVEESIKEGLRYLSKPNTSAAARS